jgi:hypothetical protein
MPDAAPDAAAGPLTTTIVVVLHPDDGTYASAAFGYACPDGAPDGPHRGSIELYSNLGLYGVQSFEWTCEFAWVQASWHDLPCGLDVWARGMAVDPVTGDTVYQVSQTGRTAACVNP